MAIVQKAGFGWRRLSDISLVAWLWTLVPAGAVSAVTGYFAHAQSVPVHLIMVYCAIVFGVVSVGFGSIRRQLVEFDAKGLLNILDTPVPWGPSGSGINITPSVTIQSYAHRSIFFSLKEFSVNVDGRSNPDLRDDKAESFIAPGQTTLLHSPTIQLERKDRYDFKLHLKIEYGWKKEKLKHTLNVTGHGVYSMVMTRQGPKIHPSFIADEVKHQ